MAGIFPYLVYREIDEESCMGIKQRSVSRTQKGNWDIVIHCLKHYSLEAQ